jgi:hypothetical protein
MTDPLDRLGLVRRQYQLKAMEYRGVLVAAARAEAAHKTARAQAILRARADGERVSHATAETIAEADETIAGLYLERLVTAAQAEAHKAQLQQLREQVANGRTFVASAREIDKMHAEGRAGI